MSHYPARYERSSKDTSDNVGNRFELFILGDGEKKVTEEVDTRKHALEASNALFVYHVGHV